jgi:polysaccharide export outer membrane protein
MRPNDIIFVEEQPITKWNRVVQQFVPSLLTTPAAIAAN